MSKHFVEWHTLADQIAADTNGATTEDIVFEFVKRFCSANANGPTIDEICWAVDTIVGKNGSTKTSGGHIKWVLEKLEEKGRIACYRRNKNRIGGRIRVLER